MTEPSEPTTGDHYKLDCPWGCKGGLDELWDCGVDVNGLTEQECKYCGRTARLRVEVYVDITAWRME